MRPKRLVLFVEGDGDQEAVPLLVKRILSEMGPWGHLFLDSRPFRIGGVHNLHGGKAANWDRWLKAAAKRPDFGGVLLLLDGDLKRTTFCAADAARDLASRARAAGAGSCFSVACVIARQEYESWLVAGAQSLRGRAPPGRSPGFACRYAGPTADDG